MSKKIVIVDIEWGPQSTIEASSILQLGKIHKKCCSSFQETFSQLKGFDTLKGALKGGIDLCSLCFNQNISFDHDYTIRERIELINLHNLCSSLKIKSKSQGRLFSIITNRGSRCFKFQKPIILYPHNNIYPTRNNKGANYYHKQPVKLTSYQDYIIHMQS